jgi:hypothetical protein
MHKTIAALLALAAASAAFAQSDPRFYDCACVIWNNTGTQVYGGPCYERKNTSTELHIGDGEGMDGVGKEFQFIIDKKGKVVGHFGEADIKEVRWKQGADSIFYWSNGQPALSIEDGAGVD